MILLTVATALRWPPRLSQPSVAENNSEGQLGVNTTSCALQNQNWKQSENEENVDMFMCLHLCWLLVCIIHHASVSNSKSGLG